MSKERKLLTDTFLYAIANFGASALSFLMLPVYTWYFSPDAFGVWDVSLTAVTLLIPLVSLELTNATYRFLMQTKEYPERRQIISTGFLQIMRQLLLIDSCLVLLFSFFSFSYQWGIFGMLNLMIVSGFLQQCARGLGRNKLFAIIGPLQTSIVIGLNLVFIFFFHIGIEAFFYAHIIAGLIVSLIAWRSLRFSQYIQRSAQSPDLRRDFFRYSLPIIPAAASWWLITMADRWFIAAYLGFEANGIYAIALKIPALLILLNTVFSLAWKDSAILSFEAADKNAYYSKVFFYYFRFMATAVICLILAAKPLLLTFIGAAYAGAWKYTGILLIASLFHALSLFWSAGFHGAKQTKSLFTTTVVGGVLNILLNIAFIPYFGLYAVALSTLVAFFVTWALRVRAAKGFFRIEMEVRDVSLLLVMIGSAVFLPFVWSHTLLVIGAFSILCYFIFINLSVWKTMWKEGRKLRKRKPIRR